MNVLKSEKTVAKEFRESLQGISVQGLLAADILYDCSESRVAWKESLPTKEALAKALPFWWAQEAQSLLPEAASDLLRTQKQRLQSDWQVVSTKLPTTSFDQYTYNWFLVGTRTFYFTHQDTPDDIDPYECIALVPFADYFNHAEHGCSVHFSPECYSFSADRVIQEGEEVFISYGNHSNDFLLAEYGFCLETNQWDVVSLDSVLSPLFDEERRRLLEEADFWEHYTLDVDSVCYRTQVAVRLLSMPSELWCVSMKSGFNEEDEYQELADHTLANILEVFLERIYGKMEELRSLDSRLTCEKDVLTRRWTQILSLVNTGLHRLRNHEN